jgi:hypothetical protein
MTNRPRRTIEQLLEDAQKYETIKDFRESDNSAYVRLSNLKLLKQATEHMARRSTAGTKKHRWTSEEIFAVAGACASRSEFQLRHRSAYNTARRRNILDLACAHMEPRRKK